MELGGWWLFDFIGIRNNAFGISIFITINWKRYLFTKSLILFLVNQSSHFHVQVEKIRKVLKDAAENNMYYNYINPQTGKWCQSKFINSRYRDLSSRILEQASIGGLGDSFYEYLLKSWVLSNKKDEQARSMYEGAIKVSRLILFVEIRN